MDAIDFLRKEYSVTGDTMLVDVIGVNMKLDIVIRLMDKYADTKQKLNIHGVMQGLLKQSDVSAAAKKHWSDASGSYAQEEIVQDSFEAGVWWACTQLSSSPTVGKAGGDASVDECDHNVIEGNAAYFCSKCGEIM